MRVYRHVHCRRNGLWLVPFFRIRSLERKEPAGNGGFFSAGDPHGAEYPDHVPFDRDSNGSLEGQRLDRVHCVSRRILLRAFGDGAGVVPALQPDLFLDGNGLWKRGDHRSDLHDHGRKPGGASALYGRRCFGRRVFRRPLFAGFHQRPSRQ